jgi:hypothetical protein
MSSIPSYREFETYRELAVLVVITNKWYQYSTGILSHVFDSLLQLACGLLRDGKACWHHCCIFKSWFRFPYYRELEVWWELIKLVEITTDIVHFKSWVRFPSYRELEVWWELVKLIEITTKILFITLYYVVSSIPLLPWARGLVRAGKSCWHHCCIN